MENLVIEPLKGYGDIKFGMSVEEIISIYGTPSNNEEMESLVEGNENYSVLYDYDAEGISICFEGISKPIVASISTNNEDATLFGERVYEMNRNQIVDLMKRNGYKEFDEEEQEGDTCLIYDELMLDFYFNEGELIDVVWGVIVDPEGNIIK
ncbi:MAG: hypothetical protein J6R17_06620 [Bacteroidales bacterium]|jgi:hypothetical protein|nr:hypothetical protein [Bacteroidales bacterium]MBO5853553.1 hypothetical protein [Bacteroidales bacterium]MBO7212027.1 hypothetical protein [Methanobrevibacter sp.]